MFTITSLALPAKNNSIVGLPNLRAVKQCKKHITIQKGLLPKF